MFGEVIGGPYSFDRPRASKSHFSVVFCVGLCMLVQVGATDAQGITVPVTRRGQPAPGFAAGVQFEVMRPYILTDSGQVLVRTHLIPNAGEATWLGRTNCCECLSELTWRTRWERSLA